MKTQFLKSLIAFLVLHFTFLISAKAQIVYTDVIPDQIFSANTSVYHLDMNKDSVIDFNISIQTGNTGGAFCTGTKPYARVIITPVAGNFVATTSTSPSALTVGDTINNTNTWSSGTLYMARDYWACVGTKPNKHWQHYSVGQWLNATDRYLGLKFTSGGNTYYGWARLDAHVFSNATANFTIKDYAYYAIANQTILAGESCAIPANLSVNGNTTLCYGDSVTLSMTPGYFYLWSNGETNSDITVSPISATYYSVLVTDTTINCTSVFAQQINVIATTSVSQICHSLVSTAMLPATIQWYDCALWQPIAGAIQNSFKPATSGNYAAIISESGCVDTTLCYNVDAVTISVSGSNTICVDESVSVSATPGYNYLWSTGETISTITVSPATTTNYTVVVTDTLLGCSIPFSQYIYLKSAHILVTQNCDSLFLTGGINPVYQWYDCANMLAVSGATNNYFTASTIGNYAAVINQNGCVDTTACHSINPMTFIINGSTSLCPGDSVTLSATGGTNYYWNVGNTTSSITVNPSLPTYYIVTVLDSITGCQKQFGQLITSVHTDTTVSQVGNILSVTLYPSTTYQWFDCQTMLPIPGATSNNYVPVTGGIYAVIFNHSGCIDTSDCYTILFQGVEQHDNNLSFNISPNPFSQSAIISWQLARNENVALKIFDLNGRLITTLANNLFQQGKHQIALNAEKLDAGIYFLKIEAGDFIEMKKLIVTK